MIFSRQSDCHIDEMELYGILLKIENSLQDNCMFWDND